MLPSVLDFGRLCPWVLKFRLISLSLALLLLACTTIARALVSDTGIQTRIAHLPVRWARFLRDFFLPSTHFGSTQIQEALSNTMFHSPSVCVVASIIKISIVISSYTSLVLVASFTYHNISLYHACWTRQYKARMEDTRTHIPQSSFLKPGQHHNELETASGTKLFEDLNRDCTGMYRITVQLM